jgi:hypothetical protein
MRCLFGVGSRVFGTCIVLSCFLSAWCVSGRLAMAALPFTYATVDNPYAIGGTWLYGISNGNIVGNYWPSTIQTYDGLGNGFLYNGSNFIPISYPGTSSVLGTQAYGIDNNKIVGTFWDNSGFEHGYVYDGNNYNTLDDPLTHWDHSTGADNASGAFGISGNKIVGQYLDSSLNFHGYVYDGTSFTTLDDPNIAVGDEWCVGIDGDNIIGIDGLGHSYVYDGSTFKSIAVPNAGSTSASAISGNLIVGSYEQSGHEHGFIYDGTTFNTVDIPGSTDTQLNGIQGDTIVGAYSNNSGGSFHGVIVTIPEPSTIALLTLGSLGLLARRRQE